MSGAAADDPAKVLRVAFPSDMTGLHPAATQDVYSNAVQRHIFDTLYFWDYLALPYRFVPSVAAGMPEISADGRVWTIRIKSGIYFDDDPAFEGKKGELTAEDFVYSWKRVMNPRLRSPNTADLEGKLVGLDAAVAKAKASSRFDYDAESPGLRAIDRYTLRIELIEPDYTFLTGLNDTGLRAVARAVVEKYADAGPAGGSLLVIEFLHAENRLLKDRLRGRRIRFTVTERALLARKAKAVRRKALLELDTIVSPDTLLRRHRRLVAQKWNLARATTRGPTVIMGHISQLIVRIAEDNSQSGYTRIRLEAAPTRTIAPRVV